MDAALPPPLNDACVRVRDVALLATAIRALHEHPPGSGVKSRHPISFYNGEMQFMDDKRDVTVETIAGRVG